MLSCENSWVISKSGRNGSDMKHHYICSCGKHTTAYSSASLEHPPDIVCPVCSNDYFIDHDQFLYHHQIHYWKTFNWSHALEKDDDGWHLEFFITVPEISESTNRVNFIHLGMKRSSLLLNGEIVNESLSNFWYSYRIYTKQNKLLQAMFRIEAASLLSEYILQNRHKAIEWIDRDKLEVGDEDQRLKALAFFLQNPHLQDEAFFLWDFINADEYRYSFSNVNDALFYVRDERTEKSIKRTMHSRYMEDFPKRYSPKFDHIVSRVFEDANYVVQLLQLPHYHKNSLFERLNVQEIERALAFLLEFYTQKELFSLFKTAVKSQEYFQYFKDILRMTSSGRDLPIIIEQFQRERANVRTIHDALVRIQNFFVYPVRRHFNKEDPDEAYEYTDRYAHAQGNEEDLCFCLPKKPKTLFEWAKELHNCMASYSRTIRRQEIVIYGVFRDKKLLYAIELSNMKIVQAKAVYNRSIPAQDMRIIRKWNIKKMNMQAKKNGTGNPCLKD